MKKLILSGSALLLLAALANAQTPGATTTGAYDDFKGTYQPEGANGIYYWRGIVAGATDTRDIVNGKETFTYTTSGTPVYLEVNWGKEADGTTARTIDASANADIVVDIENVSSSDILLKVIVKDIDGGMGEIEPNISDIVLAADNEDYIIPGATWAGVTAANSFLPLPANLDAVYPRKAYNGFILKANSGPQTIKIDLSSGGAGAMGGLRWDGYDGGDPHSMPETTHEIDPSKVAFIQFVFNENWTDLITGSSPNADAYKYDGLAAAQTTYTGSLVLRSFKFGSATTATSIKTDAAVDGSLKVGPNPTNDNLNVSFESTTESTVTLTDLTGNTVSTKTTGAGQNNVNFNTSGLNKGMYILNVTTENGKAARKISVQ